MKKEKYILIFIIIISSLSIIEWGVSFSSIFITTTMFLSYLVFPIKRYKEFKNTKVINIIYSIYKTLVILFLVSFIGIEAMILLNMNHTDNLDDINKVDTVIVLGAAINGEEVSTILKKRLDKAIEYYNINTDTDIIVSGGLGKGEVITEAEAMYNYLVSEGVNEDNIIKEEKATTTLENIRFSKEIMNEMNKEERALIVTNDFHLFRARLIGSFEGLKNQGLHSNSSLSGRLYYMIREYPTTIIDIYRSLFCD